MNGAGAWVAFVFIIKATMTMTTTVAIVDSNLRQRTRADSDRYEGCSRENSDRVRGTILET